MGLREQIAADVVDILTDEDDFGWPITLTDPSGKSEDLIGFSADIAEVIDPQTGQAVSGRFATVVFPISALISAGFATLPEGVLDLAGKPWIVDFDDINGTAYAFKVIASKPDRAMDIIVCNLGVYIDTIPN